MNAIRTALLLTAAVLSAAFFGTACDVPDSEQTGPSDTVQTIQNSLTCTVWTPWAGCIQYAPEPPAGGRYCDSRGNTTINAGEFAMYTGTNFTGWCVTFPVGDRPNLASYYMDNWVLSIRNYRSGWPVPPISIIYDGTNYTATSQSLPYGDYATLNFNTASSVKVR